MGLAQLQETNTTAQRKTIVVGLGKSGMSAARFLSRQGHDVLVVDSRAVPPALDQLKQELPEIDVRCGEFDQELFMRAGMLVVSPGISVHTAAVAAASTAGVEVVGDVELFACHAQAPVIAITGSNGKSTVTTLVGEMARAAGKDVRVGGNIGTPVLELLQSSEPDLYVLELSSFQLETTSSLKPVAAVVLNISQDHLDRYRDMHDYAAAKQRVYDNAGIKLVNLDDPVVASWRGESESWVGFSLHAPQAEADFGVVEKDGQAWLAKGMQCLLPASELKVAGMHNVANALAALALGECAGLPLLAMLESLRCFSGLPHRCQWLAEKNNINWYNDSKATNVGAAVAAIKGMSGNVVLLAGGEGKGQDFSPLRTAMAQQGRAAILFGEDGEQIANVLDTIVPVHRVSTLKQAVLMARDIAQANDAVLLAPACASFDMFTGYEDRGMQFAAAVREVLA